MAARHYYYAYERTDGDVCYLPKLLHEGIQRYPHTIGHYHLRQWLGVSKLLTPEQYKAMGWMGARRLLARQAAVVRPTNT
ncbi:hypothetical protein [Pseudoxanthomonas sp. OG2]|uniref:hypothetical protein n=1 Tax=Pseudoxanthomonas sp. OG2 TaxID=2587011 RepID=UPI0016210161|nr:hypothetical protein [Pseudoxanthomonas sp. OG2]MBB3277321.1 hypothetical protein [Pseudoxanthomonas sp. OG2]